MSNEVCGFFCPRCGHWEAFLDRMDTDGRVPVGFHLVCRKCEHHWKEVR